MKSILNFLSVATAILVFYNAAKEAGLVDKVKPYLQRGKEKCEDYDEES